VEHGYLLLACDALEALAATAGRQGKLAQASELLTGAEGVREATGYRFRFGFEQAAVDELRASMAPAGKRGNAGGRATDTDAWKTTTAPALRVAREVTGLGG
jgi:hypothetical protein